MTVVRLATLSACADSVKTYLEKLARRVARARTDAEVAALGAEALFATEVEAATVAWQRRQGQGGEEEGEEEEGEEEEEEEEEEGGEEEEEEEGEGESGAESGAEDGSDGDSDELAVPPDAPMLPAARRLVRAFNTLPDAEGSGLYPAFALLNHSCEPNAAIEWRHDSAELTIVTIRPIAAGEEVTHCYIQGDAVAMAGGLHARRYALKAHSLAEHGGFVCRCGRCTREEAEEQRSRARSAQRRQQQRQPQGRSARARRGSQIVAEEMVSEVDEVTLRASDTCGVFVEQFPQLLPLSHLRADCRMLSEAAPESNFVLSYAQARQLLARPARAPSLLLHVASLLEHYLGVAEASGTALRRDECTAEYWVQRRPPGVGIQWHFDKDEALRDACELVVHPAVSTVSYLSSGGAPTVLVEVRAAAADADEGGQLIPEEGTDLLVGQRRQVLPHGKTVRAAAFVSHPLEGKLLAFSGGLLHGAAPELAAAPAAAAPAAAATAAGADAADAAPSSASQRARRSQRAPAATPPALPAASHERLSERLTLLVNVWVNHQPLGTAPLPAALAARLLAKGPPATTVLDHGGKAPSETAAAGRSPAAASSGHAETHSGLRELQVPVGGATLRLGLHQSRAVGVVPGSCGSLLRCDGVPVASI